MNYDEKVIAESKSRYALQVSRNAFLDGVQYCEDNPAWRKCEDELPEPDTQCWCATSDGKEIIARFNGAYWRHSGTSKKDIIAWLPLPKFNSKAKNE